MVWQSLAAGAGLGLVDKIFGKKEQKPDYTHMKQGIQWRVDDAKKAGISPLAALGASTGSPTILNTDNQTPMSAAIGGAIRGGLKGAQQKREQELFLLQGNESRARTKLLEAQADAVTRSKLASDDALRKNKTMSSNDPEVEPRRLTPPPTNRSDKDARTQKMGEIGGELLNISDIPNMVKQGAYNKRDKNRAEYVYDELTGRVYRNPYKKTTKRKTRRGYR